MDFDWSRFIRAGSWRKADARELSALAVKEFGKKM